MDQIELEFSVGENKFLKDKEMNITFKNVSEDSRCPVGTNCIWQGLATVELEVMGTYTRPLHIVLSTLNDENKGLKDSEIFNGYQISLRSLTPYPTAEKGYDDLKNQYKIKLSLTKIQ